MAKIPEVRGPAPIAQEQPKGVPSAYWIKYVGSCLEVNCPDIELNLSKNIPVQVTREQYEITQGINPKFRKNPVIDGWTE